MKHFNGQYHAGDPVGPRMQDIATDVKRSRTREAVGKWELEKAFEAALAADDERDRRNLMRAAAIEPTTAPTATAPHSKREEAAA